MVVLDVVNQLLQQVATIVDLEKGVLPMRIDTSDLGVAVSDASRLLVTIIFVVMRVEHISNRGMHFLIKLEHFDDVGLLSIARSPLLVLVLFAFLVAEEVVLRLIRVYLVFVSLFLVAAWDAILVDSLQLLLT